ncbi:MAG: matrixin family metalloprotease [Verrucomicrobiota bacterium]
MKHFILLIACLLLSAVLLADENKEPSSTVAEMTVITLPVRIHLMQSGSMPDMHTTLVEADIRRVMGKVNKVWAQAGIQFEIESILPVEAVPMPEENRLKSEFVRVKSMVPKGVLSPTGIDICYVKTIKPNGFFYGEPIVVKDTASLREVPGGLDEPLPRVTSHEIGHALGLNHRQDTTNLMQSGTTGFSLNTEEITTARAKAQEYLEKHESGPAETTAEGGR